MATIEKNSSKKIFTLTFDNFAQFVEAGANQIDEHGIEQLSNGKFAGANHADGMSIMREGCEPRNFAAGAECITLAANTAMSTQRFNETQGMLSVGKYLNGSERPLLGRVWTAAAKPVIHLTILNTVSSTTSVKNLQRFGEACFSLINILERDGAIVSASLLHSGRISTEQDGQGRKSTVHKWVFNTVIPVKKAGYPAQPHVMSAAVHPFAFRGVTFLSLFDQRNKDASPDMGGTGEVIGSNAYPNSDPQYYPSTNLGFTLAYETLYSDEEAAKWVLRMRNQIAETLK